MIFVQRQASTLLRVGLCYDNLGEAVRRFDSRFVSIRSVVGNTIQFGLYAEDPQAYFLQVSKQKGGELNPAGYNFMLTLVSDSAEFNQETAAEFQRKTGIALREGPRELEERMCLFIPAVFAVLRKHGSRAMDILRQM